MKFLKFILPIFLILLLARLFLPDIILFYVKKRINQIPEYHVKIASLNMSLIQGSYTLHDLHLYKTKSNLPVPFFQAKSIDFSIEWKAILKGSLVAKIVMQQAKVNFVIDPEGKDEQLTIDKQWQNIVKSLYPLNINAVFIENSEATFQSFKGKPPFKLSIKKINGKLINMQNVDRNPASLSSAFDIIGESTGKGALKIKGKFSPFSKKPTFKLESALEHINIKEANNFLKHFTNIDVKDGDLSIFIEFAASKGKINGYAKPIIKNLQIINPDKTLGSIEILYKGALEVISKILTNPKTKTIATKINITGDIQDPETSILSIIGYILRHAFINALLPQIDHSIQMQDVIYKNSNSSR